MASARLAPVIAVVRVPPSACNTSQSAQIVRDPVAIAEYLGAGFNDNVLAGPAPAPPTREPAPQEAVHRVVEQEMVHRLIERLKTDGAAAAAELTQRGPAAVPALLEALERRDVEMRRQVFQVLQGILKGSAVFDPYAPEAQRRQQLALLREKLERKAG